MIALRETECCALAGADCRPLLLRRRAGRDRVYGKLGSDRTLADQVLIEWLGSEDEGARFDALHLVRKFRVKDARDALTRLHDRLGESSAPGAPFERRRIAETLAELGGNERTLQ